MQANLIKQKIDFIFPGGSVHPTNFLFLLFFILHAFSGYGQIWTNDLEDSIISKPWINLQLVESKLAYSGTHYAVADTFQYGLGVESNFPETVKGKNTWVRLEGRVMSDTTYDKAMFVVSMDDEKQNFFWKGIDLSQLIEEKDQWYFFSDSLWVPANVTEKAIFKAFLWNNDQKNTIAVDDLKIEFRVIQNPAFIPDIKSASKSGLSEDDLMIFANPFYKIYYAEGRNQLLISSNDQKLHLSDIKYYVETVFKSDTLRELSALDLKTIKKNNDEFQLVFTSGSARSKARIVFVCDLFKPGVKVFTEILNKPKQFVLREALVMDYRQPVKEIYRANRKTDDSHFQTEYWLDKQGLKTGEGKNAMIIYHQPGISSLQLQTAKKQIWVNFDFEKDHPFLHFPLDEDTTDFVLDWSGSFYKKKDKSSYHFTVFFGLPTTHLPRMMKNPLGFLSTYIWTEHADFTDIRTNRATYFGSENISEAKDATGGFVKYDIPVTKSVFYHNPDEITNSEISNGAFTGPESTISDVQFLDFLKQIDSAGNEICLHTPEQFTTSKDFMEEALQFVSDEFGSTTWIDHGYNNKLYNNREDLVCDGSLKKSGFYFAGLWQEYGTKYFWNPYYEDYATFSSWQFNNFLSKPYNGYGDFLPNPSYWRQVSRTGNLIHWSTKSVMYVPEDYMWDFYFNEAVLDAFVEDWDVEINHCYPAWVDPAKGFWVYDEDSTIVAAPGLNRTLERMSELKLQNKLNVTTVQKFLDYQLALEQIEYELLADGRIRVTNKNKEQIKGLSFATSAKMVWVDGLIPAQKEVDDDLIFWFDLKPGQSKVIRTFSK